MGAGVCACVFVCISGQCKETGIAPIPPPPPHTHTHSCVLICVCLCRLFSLQVLSYNLYTVLNIPHDPVALEEHFQDDDEGPVSNHGYMPYLNKYILDKVRNEEFADC